MKIIDKAVLLSALVIVLASCNSFVPKPTETPSQSATDEKPSIDFGIVAFVYDSDILNATIEIPPGWETKDNESIGGVFVADDWKDFTQGDPFGDAIGILFLRMQNGMGSASSSLAVCRRENFRPTFALFCPNICAFNVAFGAESAQLPSQNGIFWQRNRSLRQAARLH